MEAGGPHVLLFLLSLCAFLLPEIVTLLLLSKPGVVHCGSSSSVLRVERAIPLTQKVKLHELIERDRARHARLLQGFVPGVVGFPVVSSPDPFLFGLDGTSVPLLYYTKVKLGSPPREFNVQIDTGSDILWVACNSCSNCPHSSALGIQLNYFDTSSSSTARLVPCSNPICSPEFQSPAAQCSPQSNRCSYSFQYGDGSGTSGYYLSDSFYFDAILGQSVIANSSAHIVFGCSTDQSGDLTKSDKALDGILGFGRGDLSVISQLSSLGITPRVFSHCLKGDGNGGGILVLGEILEPGMVYTPLVQSQPHYNLDLQSIAVNGQLLQISAAAFATGTNQGTIIDSGTTLAYLVDEAFDAFVSAVTARVSQSATPTITNGNQCYLLATSVSEIFPSVTFNFAGGASMVLKPEEYLIPNNNHQDGASMWCIGFVRQGGVTILGDLVMKDKIFVYDLAHQRIGWANYDCSLSVNVSLTSSKDFINEEQPSVSSSSREMLLKLLPLSFMAMFLNILQLMGLPFL